MHLIVIGGAQRTGTTLLQTMIADGLTHAPILPEAHILCDLMSVYKRAKSEGMKTSKYYPTTDDLRAFFREVADLHFSALDKIYTQIDHLVLKDPNFSQVLPELFELFPTLKPIICVRDPRDIAASFVKIGERQREIGMETAYTKRNVGLVCKKINASYRFLFECPQSGPLLLVRYESLVRAPVETLRDVGIHLGLPVDPKRSHSSGWLEEPYRHQKTWVTELEGKEPTAQSVGSYAEILSPKEIGKVEELCADAMKIFDYRPTETAL